MITVISGTNRPDSNTRKLAAVIQEMLHQNGQETTLIDLAELPTDLFTGSSYATKPDDFAVFQEAVIEADGLLSVVPEYNGSFPGVLKYFIDMLRFPESLYEKPAAFVGLSAGRWGGVRAVEHLEMVFQYRHAHLFGRRCFIPRIGSVLDESASIADLDTAERLEKTVTGFSDFCAALRRQE
jgi:NAD(P)H-dependent FMN reductase